MYDEWAETTIYGKFHIQFSYSRSGFLRRIWDTLSKECSLRVEVNRFEAFPYMCGSLRRRGRRSHDLY